MELMLCLRVIASGMPARVPRAVHIPRTRFLVFPIRSRFGVERRVCVETRLAMGAALWEDSCPLPAVDLFDCSVWMGLPSDPLIVELLERNHARTRSEGRSLSQISGASSVNLERSAAP